jgi:hypothetical protein
MANPAHVVTGKVRISYANVFNPKSINGGDEKYSGSFLVRKDDEVTLEKINSAVEVAIADGIATKWNGKRPGNLKLPLRDGDKERADDPAYVGHYFFNASSKNAPQIVSTTRDADGKPEKLTDTTKLFSGCYVRAGVDFYPFNANGNRGVAVGLQTVQLLETGAPLGASASATDDFADDYEDDGEIL